jgi:hypothetical protein
MFSCLELAHVLSIPMFDRFEFMKSVQEDSRRETRCMNIRPQWRVSAGTRWVRYGMHCRFSNACECRWATKYCGGTDNAGRIFDVTTGQTMQVAQHDAPIKTEMGVRPRRWNFGDKELG